MDSAKIHSTSRRGCISAIKLIIDTQIPILNASFGWNLMAGVPYHCKTIGDFKKHLSSRYILISSPFNLFVDEFCISDEEDCEIFSFLNGPVRVIPVVDTHGRGGLTPSPLSGTLSSIIKINATQENLAVMPSEKSIPSHERKKVANPTGTSTPTPSTTTGGKEKVSQMMNTKIGRDSFGTDTTGFDEHDIPPIDNNDQRSPFQKPITSPRIFSAEPKTLTSSARRRIRLRKSVQKKATEDGISIPEILNYIPFKPLESQSEMKQSKPVPLITLDSRKETDGWTPIKLHSTPLHSTKSVSFYDSIEDFGNIKNTLSSTIGSKRKRPTCEEFLQQTSPLKIDRHILQQKTGFAHPSTWEKREDTPRVPKSVKNQAALSIFKSLEFTNGRPESNLTLNTNTTKDRRADYLKDTFKKLVKHLDETCSTIDEIRSTEDQESSVAGTLDDSTQTSEVMELETTAVTMNGASGPLDVSFYDNLQPLTSIDHVCEKSIIAFKIIELNENYEAGLSKYKEAIVLEKKGIDLTLEYLKADSIIRCGKFEIEGYTSDELQNPSILSFTMLIGPKLVRPPPPTTEEAL